MPLLRRLARLRPLSPLPAPFQLRLRASARCYSSPSPARTRFAPSPTGFMHLGSLRTALFNYLLARSTGGQFLLRIEDTDQKRTVEGAEENIFEVLRWAGLQWDEGPEVGGSCGPYRQSERSDLHREHAQELIDEGHAYRCFCTPERLKALAISRKRAGLPSEYDRTCSWIPTDESENRAAAGEPHTIRLKAPEVYPEFTDIVYGKIQYGENIQAHASGSYEDPVLLKSDGLPTYHLANVVDDHHMGITHVCRATEWLPSTPKHVHLYECFGWNAPMFVHVGLLQDPSGRKLSKRTGDIFVSEYRDRGYLPETLNNFVALLGWSHDEGNDVLGLEDLVRLFDTRRLTPGNTVVDFGKLNFLQRRHAQARIAARGTSDAATAHADEILDPVVAAVHEKFGDKLETGAPLDHAYVSRVLHANQQNYLLPSSFADESRFFYVAPPRRSKAMKRVRRQVATWLKRQPHLTYTTLMAPLLARLHAVPTEHWNVTRLEEVVARPSLDPKKEGETEQTVRELWTAQMRALRLALAEALPGPTLASTMYVLGRERALQRIEDVAKRFGDGADEEEEMEEEEEEEREERRKE